MTLFSGNVAHSVVFQILLAMALIAGMALASMSLSVYVTTDTLGDAEAINLAGSLRMQSYRIGYTLSQATSGAIEDPRPALEKERLDFAEKLHFSSISESVKESGNTPLKQSYLKVVSNWSEAVEPLLASLADENVVWEDIWRQYDVSLAEYVADIDYMVTHLQRNTEAKIELLGMTEAVSIIFILFIVIFFVMKADNNFVMPLRRLVQAARRVEGGDLAQRIDYSGNNELGLLSQTFNNMTESLQQQYRTLEERVAERTDELRKSNQALYFLYKITRKVASDPHNERLLRGFLGELKRVADVELINLCISADPNYIDYKLISTDPGSDDPCVGECVTCEVTNRRLDARSYPDISLPLKNRNDTFGFLYIRTRDGRKLDDWQRQLLNTVTETLSTALAFHHTLGQERRIILLEERSTIARELHDSLAQSLSYMKIETTRLKKMIARGFDTDLVEDALNDLQEGLNAAYKHLRELLITFRVKLDAPNLHSALEHAVVEFDELTPAQVTLEYGLGGCVLRPNEDIHILQILREALSNAVKHSRATDIALRCERDDAGEIVFSVEDNGIGLPQEPEKMHHYGMFTMRERAKKLDGVLACSRRTAGGTRIELRIRQVPDLMRA